MIQLKPYSVYVHGTFIDEVVFKLLGVRSDADGNPIAIGSFEKQPDYTIKRNPAGQIRTKIENFIISKGYLLPDSSAEALAYERTVMELLVKISKSLVGGTMLRCMNRDCKVIIVPHNTFQVMSRGMCNATTSNRKSFEGYIRITHSPDSACEQTDRRYPTSEDETLLHELFHAYLATVNASEQFYGSMQESQTVEEFLAVQVTNMYRAETGRGVFQRAYGGYGTTVKQPNSVSRAELEAYFASDQEARKALNPDGVPLFQQLAKYPQLPLNPFREWGKYLLKATQPGTPGQVAPKLKTMIPPAL